jgi:hypothetical protein
MAKGFVMKVIAVGVLFLFAASKLQPVVGQGSLEVDDHQMLKMNNSKFKDWLARWERNVIAENPMRYCTTETGEAIGWKLRPFLAGFYYGYLATRNLVWIDKLVVCADSLIKRAVKEPDGFIGWPAFGAAGTDIDHLDDFYADSMLGEAMALTPVILMAAEIQRTPSLKTKYGVKADEYIAVSERIFKKWDSRKAWRETPGGGMITVELPFGIDQKTWNWTGEYDINNQSGIGFSHQDNKANLIACWLLAMFDATAKPIYSERAEKWFLIMKSRIALKNDGTYRIWNYWEPAGPWDYKSNGLPKHWIGVHPKAGYYDIDVEGIVAAYEHGLIFTKDDIKHLIATALMEKRYWTALVPYDDSIQNRFEDTLDPGSWDGLQRAPWYLAIQPDNSASARTGRAPL